MGKGTIVGGGADGYYDLQLDITLGNIVAERDKLRVKEAELRLKLSEAKIKKSDAQAKLISTNQALTLAIDAYNAGPSDAQRAAVENATRAERDARTALKDASQLVDAITADQNAYKNQLAELKKLIESASPLETEKSNIQSRINTLQSNIATATATKQAALSDLNALNAALSAAQLLYSQDPSTENRDALTRAERNQAIGAQKYAEADAEVTRIQNDLTAAEASLADVSTSILKLEELKAEAASVQANINHIEEVTKPAAIADRTEKQTALNNAIEARKAAQAAYNADPSPANLQALNDAIAAESAALTAYTQAISNLEKVESDLTAVEVRLLDIEKAMSYQAAVRPAWCVDLSESLTGTVSTVEINGDTRDGVLIRPGYTDSAVYIDKRDGVVSLPQTMSPYSTFFNWALKPAVQRWRPQYRSAVIDKIDYDANTCTITLDESPSMESPPLVLNDPVTLANVPINYMYCNAYAFQKGDRVVVEFSNRSPSQGKVIGFRTHPRSCFPNMAGNRSIINEGGAERYRVVKWENKVATEIGFVSGYEESFSQAISKDGKMIVGGSASYLYNSNRSTIYTNKYCAFKWTKETGFVSFFGDSNYPYTVASDISDDGSIVVGTAYKEPPFGDIFVVPNILVWKPNGHTIIPLHTVIDADNGRGYVKNVSADGKTVIGDVRKDANLRFFVWSETGGLFIANELRRFASGVSADGTYLAIFDDVYKLVYRWSMAGGYTLCPMPTGFGALQPVGISNDGQTIIGTTHNLTTGIHYPYKWTPSTGTVPITLPSNVTSAIATSASSDGSIIAGYIHNGDPTVLGKKFIWTQSSGMDLFDSTLQFTHQQIYVSR